MEPLTIESIYDTCATHVVKISGFTEEELHQLNSLGYKEFKEAVLEALDKRNGGLGTRWKYGYGVYLMWISDNAVMAEVGKSCD